MCTVVVQWAPGTPTEVLALRDERTDRDFDDPGEWWPDAPGVVGGRDRAAGGTWCAVDVARGVSALVLNRPDKRVADAGAPSRGVLPLLAARHRADWPAHVDVGGMASFLLVLASPQRLTSWTFDGTQLVATEHEPGTQMFTSGFEERGKVDRYLPGFRRTAPGHWRELVTAETPADDPSALLVRHEVQIPEGSDPDGRDPDGPAFVFATVFGQLFTVRSGHLDLRYSRHPETDEPWRTAEYG